MREEKVEIGNVDAFAFYAYCYPTGRRRRSDLKWLLNYVQAVVVGAKYP
ncbi:MAG: hypothetical protein KAR20_22055 [Candidatus Heimdallarchaeota archaeon]|nr:hypothetical protein [Candidatus Heimdallarchaeota archaeon]